MKIEIDEKERQLLFRLLVRELAVMGAHRPGEKFEITDEVKPINDLLQKVKRAK